MAGKWITVKNINQVKLKGISVDATSLDGQIRDATFTDLEGNAVKFVQTNYSVTLSVLAPPEKKTVYRLAGKLLGKVPLQEDFDDRYDAEVRKRDLDSDETVLDITEVQVDAE